MDKTSNKYQAICIYLALALTTLAVFWQVRAFSFVNYDDPRYITENQHVQAGLTRDGIVWAFTTSHGSNWHPVTWLSHMLDCQLFGTEPGWHHLTNLLLHIINTLLLFAIFKQMTGALWQSAFVAGAFALHPLHVESVAWIAERKDVLSGFFWILTIAAYLRYVKRPRASGYLLMLLVFSLGLMAKPMLVTLPFVLLLLDYWPLGRFQNKRAKDISRETHKSQKSSSQWQELPRLICEKIPLFGLSAISCIITLLIEAKGAGSSLDSLPLKIRIANVPIAYLTYLVKTIWPSNLAVLYPHPGDKLAVWQVIVGGLALAGIFILVIRSAPAHRYLAVGWLWFIGTLIPVIGLVQVGSQAWADRYTYLPLTGIFIMVSWGSAELLTRRQYRKIVLGTSAVALFAALMICSRMQLRYWRNSIALFEHALKTTKNNAVMHYDLGIELKAQGKLDEAISHYRQALQIKPDYADAYNNLGYTLGLQGKFDEAISCLHEALRLNPSHCEAHNNLGLAFQLQGNFDEALRHYRQALQSKPDWALPLNGMAWILATHPNPKMRDGTQAVALAERAAELTKHQDANILKTLAAAYAAAGQRERAITTLQTALKLASAAGDDELANQIRSQLESYKQVKP